MSANNITEITVLSPGRVNLLGEHVDYNDGWVLPIAIDKAALERGRERFNIYCAVCHDALGTGNGKIVERGYLPPPNYHLDFSRGLTA